eukprot:COSAG01_NODE_5449_length_4258_cov_2.190430_1_plen_102_part_00
MHECLVTLRGDVVVGACVVADYGSWALVCAVAVDRALRRQRYGKRLLQAALHMAVARKWDEVHVFAPRELHDFFLSQGFSVGVVICCCHTAYVALCCHIAL